MSVLWAVRAFVFNNNNNNNNSSSNNNNNNNNNDSNSNNNNNNNNNFRLWGYNPCAEGFYISQVG